MRALVSLDFILILRMQGLAVLFSLSVRASLFNQLVQSRGGNVVLPIPYGDGELYQIS